MREWHLADGDLLFAGTWDFAPGTTLGPYANPFWEFAWILAGGGTAEIEGHTQEIGVGTVLLLPPRTRNRYAWSPGGATRQALILFRAPEDRSLLLVRHLRTRDLVFPIFTHALYLSAERPPSWQTNLSRTIDYAVDAFLTAVEGGDTAPDFSAAVLRVSALLRELWSAGPMRSPTLHEMATAAGVSRERLCRVFAHELGHAPVSTVRLLRLGRAATLLSLTDMSVAEISRQTGFESEFHFSRAFRAVSGSSPSAFRAGRDVEIRLPDALRRFAARI